MNTRKALIVVDNQIVIIADPEKQVLIQEVCKHFSERWNKEVAGTSNENKYETLAASIESMMRKMSIVCDVHVVSFGSVNVLADDEPKAEEEPEKAAVANFTEDADGQYSDAEMEEENTVAEFIE